CDIKYDLIISLSKLIANMQTYARKDPDFLKYNMYNNVYVTSSKEIITVEFY
ncbi:hypothetical protein PMLGA01_100039400, partial [Plasmodium malariae]